MLNRTATTTLQPTILAAAPRCGARTRAGHACRSPAIHGRARCRMHGGKGSGAPRGNRNGWKHGGRSAGFRAVAAYIRASSRFLAAARLARRACASGGDGGLALRLALALRADLPALPRFDGFAPCTGPAPRGAGAPLENRKSAIQPHAPGITSARLPRERPRQRPASWPSGRRGASRDGCLPASPRAAASVSTCLQPLSCNVSNCYL